MIHRQFLCRKFLHSNSGRAPFELIEPPLGLLELLGFFALFLQPLRVGELGIKRVIVALLIRTGQSSILFGRVRDEAA